MMDQKAKFSLKGISTEFLGEDQMDQNVIKNVLMGNVQLVYISPECVMNNIMYRNMILSPTYNEKLVALVIDEVHCVKSWYS
jgi:bloom syndrome protein